MNPSAERWATPLKWFCKKKKKKMCLVHSALARFIIWLSFCSTFPFYPSAIAAGLSWSSIAAWWACLSDLFIIHHLHLLPPILFLVLWFIKTRLHKKQFPLNHRHCGMKIFWSYSIIQETGWGVESGLFEFHSQDILSSKVADLCVTCLFEILKVAKKWNLERFQSLGMWLISEWKSHSYCT